MDLFFIFLKIIVALMVIIIIKYSIMLKKTHLGVRRPEFVEKNVLNFTA